MRTEIIQNTFRLLDTVVKEQDNPVKTFSHHRVMVQ